MERFLLTIMARRLSFVHFKKSLSETTRLTAAIFFIIIGADIFSKFLALSTIPVKITQFVSGLSVTCDGNLGTDFIGLLSIRFISRRHCDFCINLAGGVPTDYDAWL